MEEIKVLPNDYCPEGIVTCGPKTSEKLNAELTTLRTRCGELETDLRRKEESTKLCEYFHRKQLNMIDLIMKELSTRAEALQARLDAIVPALELARSQAGCGVVYCHPNSDASHAAKDAIGTIDRVLSLLRNENPVKLWRREPPDEQALWWWWNEDGPPVVVDIFVSDTITDFDQKGPRYFATQGQHGWNRAQWVEDMGGYWMRCFEPLLPATLPAKEKEEKRSLCADCISESNCIESICPPSTTVTVCTRYKAPQTVSHPDLVPGLYEELLMAVGKKFPGESRHETALRYIREADREDGIAVIAAAKGGER